jgi:hypothetical protein
MKIMNCTQNSHKTQPTRTAKTKAGEVYQVLKIWTEEIENDASEVFFLLFKLQRQKVAKTKQKKKNRKQKKNDIVNHKTFDDITQMIV